MNEKGYKKFEEYERDAKSLYKQWKAGMINKNIYMARMNKIREYAFREITEWKCPACLNVMEFHPGDMVAEFRCDCGRNYNRTYLLKTIGEARREIRRSYLAINRHYQAQNKAYHQNKHESDIPVRVSSKVLHKDQKSIEDY